MRKRKRHLFLEMAKRAGAVSLSAAMVFSGLYWNTNTASAAEVSWKTDVESAIDGMTDAMTAKDNYEDAAAGLQTAYDQLESSAAVENLQVVSVEEDSILLQWDAFEADNLRGYNVYWSDKNEADSEFLLLNSDGQTSTNEEDLTVSADSIEPGSATITFTVPDRKSVV